ncbi:unnamed protein product [Symbiodinium microadriaticum]|nr:unnamed protein product [Symbiodinium microadriaticum]
MAAATQISFAVWQAILNNFAVEMVSFDGAQMGLLQSLREVPGFLAFTAVFVLLILREQYFALLALAMLGLGTAATGFFPTVYGLYFTTVFMSVGYHYYETMQTSLSLQWIEKGRAPQTLGRIIAVGSFAALAAFALIYVTKTLFELEFKFIYLAAGGTSLVMVLFCVFAFPTFTHGAPQRKHLVLRKRYWLYYMLTFLAGARRQIFVVFAAFMMVEKFGFSVEAITALFLINTAANMIIAPKIGRLIARMGERSALTLEYIGLILIFTTYAFVENPWIASGLYILDHAFLALAISIKTYFQKIADPGDIAPTAGVGFSINHIAAVVIPALFGILWLSSPSAVFLIGAGIAGLSLIFSRLIPRMPQPGEETVNPRLNSGLKPQRL